MPKPDDLYEYTLGELYENLLRRLDIDQKHFAELLFQVTLGTPLQRASAETWETWLSRIRAAKPVGGQPNPAVIHVLAEQLHCSLYDERRLLRAADVYPTDDEIASALGSARSYAEALRWPACFIDYRFGVLGWTAAFGREVLMPTLNPAGVPGSAGADLGPDRIPWLADVSREAVEQLHAVPSARSTKRSRRRSGKDQAENVSEWLERPHLLDYFFAPTGILAQAQAGRAGASNGDDASSPLLDDVTRLMVLVRAYWQPLSLWAEARHGWQRVKEALWRSYPGFQERWERAGFEWYKQLHGPYDALTDSPLANVVHVTLRGRQLRINSTRLGVDPRVELFEWEDITPVN